MQRVQLPSGVELHYERAGSGTPLVFIHGAMGDWRSWEAQWEAFTAHFDCIAYSRRYSFPNRNEMASPDHSALHEAEDLRQMLDALGIERAILVGSSYGGFTALAFAVSHPQRVVSLVAVEPPMMRYAQLSEAGRAARAAFRRDTIEPANAAFRAGNDELAGRIMTGGINGANGSANSPEQMQRRLQNLRAMRMLALSTDEFPLLAPTQLAALPMPVLLISGENTPPVHREIFNNVVQAMPHARAVRVPGAGHGVSREQAAVFNELVLGFVPRGTVIPDSIRDPWRRATMDAGSGPA
ncbi:alpha/beta fold hydrolase [Ramlibacter albus]|uniref:Alpha/beta hydrolase n=1 Tax=Ramlibacter albus TaxID=2079448 RepID=A0A923M9K7_9BURK|nr:alpha/beta hydrolase [Ramlibacter albus]MBC5766338.1 alpha/beta hydrolase [Ramlibacter albus]